MRLRSSWLIVAVALVVLFGPQVRAIFPYLGIGAYAVALVYALVLLLSVLLHEAAHALSARAYGWPVTEIELNLWGGHTQFAAANARPGSSLAVALAGPAANLAVAGVGWALIELFSPVGVAGMLASMTVLMNFLVGLFNLLPGHPLDGGRIVESAVWAMTRDVDRGMLAAGWAGRIVVVGLLLTLGGMLLIDAERINLVVVVVTVMVSFILWQGATEAVRTARGRLTHRRRR